jgi:hypothetical protein
MIQWEVTRVNLKALKKQAYIYVRRDAKRL